MKTLFFLKQYAKKDLWLLLFLGISSGVPFLLILSTLSYWLNELNFSVSEVSLFSAVTLPYCLKAFFAPFLEKREFPYLNKFFKGKKSFAFLAQLCICIMLFFISKIDPLKTPHLLAIFSFFIAFFAAIQDIVIDGLRIERFYDESSGKAASFSGVGFHLGKFASGSGTLYLAHWYNWQTAYQLMIFAIIPGMIALYFFTQSKTKTSPSFSVKEAFTTLNVYKNLKWMIAFIVLFKICDAILQGTSATFLYGLGLSKIEFANLTKVYGTIWMLLGTVLGGFAIDSFGLYSVTFGAALLQAISCLLFAIQAHIGYDPLVLNISVGVESFTSGLVICAAISMISHFVKKEYCMSHYTLLYAIGSLSRVFITSISGYLVDIFGWVIVYSSLSLFIIPLTIIIYKLQKHERNERI
jgi:PAT family beta-lactamase induction signal transducer AmpG